MINASHTASVVIPTCNRKKFLVRAIESALSQTIPPHEIIVVDDNSDFSVEDFIRANFRKKIRVITNSENKGAAESRNTGVRHATGEFVAFLDSDDYWHPDKTKKQLALFQENKHLALACCKQWLINHKGEIKKIDIKLITNKLASQLINGWLAPNTSTLMFRRTAFLDFGGFDPNLSSCQDHDLWMRIAFGNFPAACSPEYLAYFSMESSIRISFDCKKRLAGMTSFLSKWEDKIIGDYGRKKFSNFKKNYHNKVVFPLFVNSLKNRNLQTAMPLFLHYLFFNKFFYRRIPDVCRKFTTMNSSQ